jgi:hypothetical protein
MARVQSKRNAFPSKSLHSIADPVMPGSGSSGNDFVSQTTNPHETGMQRKNSPSTKKKWSAKVTRENHALVLKDGVFSWSDPDRIAQSLSQSAKKSTHRKSDSYRSAISMRLFT